MEFSCKELLDTIPSEQYKTLKFGGVPDVCIGLFGKANTKSFEKLLQTYHVPQGELIVAHLTKKILLIIDGVLITYNALYINPNNCSENASNRIPWSEIHKYFAAHANDTAATVLYQPGNRRYVLLRPTLVDTASGNELTEFMLEMQAEILKNYPELKVDRKKQFQILKSECKSVMLTATLSEETESILINLFHEAEFVEEAALLVAANYARLHPQSQYRQWVQSLPESISQELREKLNSLWVVVAQELLRSLNEGASDFATDFLSSVYQNYTEAGAASGIEMRIQAILCAKLKKWNDLEKIVCGLHGFGMDDEANSLYSTRFHDANGQMLEVLRVIKENKATLKKDMISCCDSMGLTPYHYALIFENSKVLANLLHSKSWPELTDEQNSAFEDTGIYDLLALAAYKNLPYEDFEKIVLQVDEKAQQLKKVIFSLQAERTASTAAKTFFTCVANAASKSAQSGCDYFTDEQYASAVQGKSQMERASNDLNKPIENAKSDLMAYIYTVRSNARQVADKWQKSKDPAVRYLLHLYSDSEYLEKVLCNSGKWTIYYADSGFRFMAPEGEIESYNLQEGEEEYTNIEKCFEDSWFSMEAHINIDALKKEFRALAKKYHPDILGNLQSSKIFQEISAEYEQLQKTLLDIE